MKIYFTHSSFFSVLQDMCSLILLHLGVGLPIRYNVCYKSVKGSSKLLAFPYSALIYVELGKNVSGSTFTHSSILFTVVSP